MMPTQNDLFQQIMGVIATAPEWEDVQKTDPDIKQTEEKLNAAIDQLKSICSYPDIIELEDVVMEHSMAMTDAAMLYGARVAICMLTATGAIAPAAFGGRERSKANGVYTGCHDSKDGRAL